MKIQSLGFQTNLMFARFSGTVTDKGSHTLIRTPSNPGYHWGNYLIFDRPPRKGDHAAWTRLFDESFEYYQEPHHYVFAWEGDAGDCDEFVAKGFERDSAVVLTAGALNPPPYPNGEIKIKKIATEQEWAEAIENQHRCAHAKYLNAYYMDFKRRQMAQYRAMSEAGKGHWFGAYLNGEIVGDLGLFGEAGVGRYQSVGTRPEFRKRGICGTLVYETGRTMMKELGLRTLVMEADPEYHAARIYESVGFKRNETNHAISWWKK